MAREVPPPGEAIRRRELEALRADVRSFAHMLEGRDDRWEALELKFGLAGKPVAPLELKGGEVAVRGAIDRVDRGPDGLVVIDYKTGSTSRYERHLGTFNGGWPGWSTTAPPGPAGTRWWRTTATRSGAGWVSSTGSSTV